MRKKIIIIAVLVAAAFICSYGSGEEVGKIHKVDKGKREVHVSTKSGHRLNMGDLLQIETDGGKIVLEVISPMLTLSKCKLRGKGRLSQLSKGMRVSRYSKDESVEDTAVKPGKTEIFGNIEFCYIPGGTFMMGSPASEKERESNEKQHRVTVSPF
ncbi:MAG TPA: hypothetical protein P5120_17375, partial [Spirochaetota bacterium]|nr:hypothetical protein [Spirochaetota bacterium]